MWPINRVVVSPSAPDGNTWLLPCDWGCSETGDTRQTGAFAMRTTDGGATWTATDVIGGVATVGLCPEPAMAYVNATTLVAVVRSAQVGFTQAWSHDDGLTWTTAIMSAVDGATSKPSLTTVPPPEHSGTEQVHSDFRTLLLAYNEITRVRMSLSISRDGGDTWQYYATLENGTGIGTDCYPTNIVVGNEVLTVYSTYTHVDTESMSDINTQIEGKDSISDIRLARTPLPHH